MTCAPHTKSPLPSAALELGGRFLDALATRDFDALAATLAPDVRFRALLPRRDIDTCDRDVLVDALRCWIGPERGRLDVLDATVGQVGTRLYLRWRLQLTDGDDAELLEQHAFATTDERITSLSLLCSGFQPTVPS